MLPRLHAEMGEKNEGKLERRRSKRQRLVQFFKTWKQKPQGHDDAPVRPPVRSVHPLLPAAVRSAAQTRLIVPKMATTITTITPPAPQSVPQNIKTIPIEPQIEHQNVKTTPAEPLESVDPPKSSPISEEESTLFPLPLLDEKESAKATTLGEEQVRILFAGAPHFHIASEGTRFVPTASFPWDSEVTKKHVSDSLLPSEPAFAAATLYTTLEGSQTAIEHGEMYKGYHPDVVEVPSMLSSQGVEPGTVGLTYFLELPLADSLITGLEQSQSSKGSLEVSRNKELMQTSPERLGIRPVQSSMIYDRLIELQDVYEAFQDTPEPMTILNNQSSGDLYANLFTRFLSPPGYDDSADDPTGLQIQIMALLRILGLKGVWYDFSLVEWRIRLGQILWSDPEPTLEHDSHLLWTAREVLLLQITLACELLLRLDAFTNADENDAEIRLRIDPRNVTGFLKTKTQKVDWDLVLARSFLENIAIMKGSDVEGLSPLLKPRGFLSLLSGNGQPETAWADIIFLPQRQNKQLSGLLQFAESIHWPDAGDLIRELTHKLGMQDDTTKPLPSNTTSFDPTTPSCISVYGTPLQTPLPSNQVLDSYFGNAGKPILNRNDSQALRIPLSPSWSSSGDRTQPALDKVGGWLSRSFLTGLVLPGEAMSHFLISTLLENDKSAIEKLGDSANLYGGFTYQKRTWWSKNSIVGRVLACVEGSTESMGWISCTKQPEGLTGWHNIHSEQLPHDLRLRLDDGSDPVAQDSAIVPGGLLDFAKSEDFVLPKDSVLPPPSSLAFTHWELTPINPDLIDDDNLSGSPTESDIHAGSVTFGSHEQASSYTLTLAYDIQFVSSWPCTPPASTAAPPTSLPYILKRSRTDTLSRSSSKHSMTLSRRSSHGYEPLLSHPPAAADITPKRMYDAGLDDSQTPITQVKPMKSHPLHKFYLYKIVPVTDILAKDFELPFAMYTSKSTERLLSLSQQQENTADTIENSKKTVLILDARASPDMELLARAWCAENGLHAIIGRTSRTCLACCIREARGLNIKIVIRV